MGTVASNFPGDDGTILADIIKPADDEWILKHAKECNVPEADVKALWVQFQELGCNENGLLQKDSVTNGDAMALKIFKEFPANINGEVAFQTFCNASRWYKNADTEARVRVAFCTLNSGQPLDQTILNEILAEVYQDSSQEVVERLGRVFMEQVDTKKQGFIDEDQFVNWIKNMPQDIIEATMDFNPTSESDQKTNEESTSDVTVTDNQLQVIANEASQQDWALLANKLGFTLEDVAEVSKKFPDKPQDQLHDILKQWQKAEAESATMSALEDILRDAGMTKVIEKLKV
ncbi:uncharacterized protein [Amphiura filiformis]|uniref:uncharacterized protein n=1 Tax=Amphiura filiformis TaxID=82378 RepID=UPI003B212452